MAITFPRELPFDGCLTEDSPFWLSYQQSHALTGGASPNVADLGPAYWAASYQTKTLSRASFDEWAAWLESLRGGLRLFKGRQARRKWPAAYPKGFAGLTVAGSPFDGTGNLQTIGTLRDTVTVNQVPAGFGLGIGDYFSVPVGSRQHLHRVMESATANGSGVVTLTVEPTLRPNAATGVAVRFEAAYCDMVVTSRSLMPFANGRGGVVAFEAHQALI